MTLSTEDMHGFYTIERPCDVITEADIESDEEDSVCEFINHVHACHVLLCNKMIHTCTSVSPANT